MKTVPVNQARDMMRRAATSMVDPAASLTVGDQRSIRWQTSWPEQDEETCEYRFHILTAFLACESATKYNQLEVGAGFGYWTGTHLMALRRFNMPLLDRVQIHVVDGTSTVDDCLQMIVGMNGFDIPTERLSAQRAFLGAVRSGPEYDECQRKQARSPPGACSFHGGGATANKTTNACTGNMADVLSSISGDVDVMDVDIQGYEGDAFTPEALLIMEERVKAAFVAPHDNHVRMFLPNGEPNPQRQRVLKLYETFSTGVWRAICLQHPDPYGWKLGGVLGCDGVIAALNTNFYDVVFNVNGTHVRVSQKRCGERALAIPLMNPFTSWPHWKEPTVERDPIYQLWKSPWAGTLNHGEAVSFMGLKFPQKVMPWQYRGHFPCYKHKAKYLAEQEQAFINESTPEHRTAHLPARDGSAQSRSLREASVVEKEPHSKLSTRGLNTCFARVMRAHVLKPECMERHNYAQGPSCTGPVLPQPAVYVLHAAHLTRRRASIEAQLKRLCAADVTWVLCCSKEQYEAELTDQQRFCIHPCVADNFWNPTRKPIANGTISLAMKHKAAYIDMMDRNLSSALVLEDDAHLQPDIWGHLKSVRLPANATVYYVGSYTQNDNSFGAGPPHSRHAMLPGQHPTGLSVHERNNSLWPAILGSVGYVIYPPGALVLGERPIIAAADIELSIEPDEYRIDCTFDEKGRPKFSQPGTPGFRECSNRCTVRDGSGHSKTFKMGSPSPQFGPNRWLVWPDRSLGGGTHLN